MSWSGSRYPEKGGGDPELRQRNAMLYMPLSAASSRGGVLHFLGEYWVQRPRYGMSNCRPSALVVLWSVWRSLIPVLFWPCGA